jgi:hypothetical protein
MTPSIWVCTQQKHLSTSFQHLLSLYLTVSSSTISPHPSSPIPHYHPSSLIPVVSPRVGASASRPQDPLRRQRLDALADLSRVVHPLRFESLQVQREACHVRGRHARSAELLGLVVVVANPRAPDIQPGGEDVDDEAEIAEGGLGVGHANRPDDGRLGCRGRRHGGRVGVAVSGSGDGCDARGVGHGGVEGGRDDVAGHPGEACEGSGRLPVGVCAIPLLPVNRYVPLCR